MNTLIKKISMVTMLIMMATAVVPAANADAATKSFNTVKKSSQAKKNCNTVKKNSTSKNCNTKKKSNSKKNCNTATNSNCTFTSGKLNYKVTGKNTVSCTGLAANCKNAKSITIPKSVTCNGKTYQVTSVKSNAFSNCANLKQINCNAKLVSQGKNCFGNIACKFAA